MNIRAPALFVSHGSPMMAVQPGLLGPMLRTLGDSLQNIKAFVVISPHWQSNAMKVMRTAKPKTIHDFGGFPSVLYTLQYLPKGAPEVSDAAARLLIDAGFAVSLDEQRGLDHGAWVPLLHLRPAADIPVLQVSMPHSLTTLDAWRMGAALKALRNQGVMIIGSGSLTHNLYEFGRAVSDPEYASEFADWIADAIHRKDADAIRSYRTRAPHATRAHPSEEHFLPLVVAMAASDTADHLQHMQAGISDGVFSMDSFVWQ